MTLFPFSLLENRDEYKRGKDSEVEREEGRVKTALATEWPIILRGSAAAGDVPHQRDRVSYQSNITASSTGDAGVRACRRWRRKATAGSTTAAPVPSAGRSVGQCPGAVAVRGSHQKLYVTRYERVSKWDGKLEG